MNSERAFTSGQVRILIKRNSPKDIKIRGLQIFLDDKFVGDLLYNRQLELEGTPGKHVLKATNTLFTTKLEIEARDGEELEFLVGNHMPGTWAVMLVAIGIAP